MRARRVTKGGVVVGVGVACAVGGAVAFALGEHVRGQFPLEVAVSGIAVCGGAMAICGLSGLREDVNDDKRVGIIDASLLWAGVVIFLLILSVPIGWKEQEKDIADAKAFIEKVARSVHAEHGRTGEYPRSLSGLPAVNLRHPAWCSIETVEYRASASEFTLGVRLPTMISEWMTYYSRSGKWERGD